MIVLSFSELPLIDISFINNLIPHLPPDQKAYAEASPVGNIRRERVVSYLLLMHALQLDNKGIRPPMLQRITTSELKATASRLLGAPHPSQPVFLYGTHGKPSFANGAMPHFNLSHCRRAVVVALHESAVGIDVESRRRISDQLMRHTCSTSELETVLAAPDPTDAFIRLWTRKESYVKYTGTGLTVPIPTLLNNLPEAITQQTLPLPDLDAWVTITSGIAPSSSGNAE